MSSRDLRQSVRIAATPHAVYETLMDSKKHAALIGATAKIGRRPGEAFSAWDGWLEGRTLELVKDKRIIQAWRGSDWPKGRYSCVVFDLKKAGRGTKLTLTQTGIPAAQARGLARGWKEFYWDRFKEMFG